MICLVTDRAAGNRADRAANERSVQPVSVAGIIADNCSGDGA
jgi:hypothetical protein